MPATHALYWRSLSTLKVYEFIKQPTRSRPTWVSLLSCIALTACGAQPSDETALQQYHCHGDQQLDVYGAAGASTVTLKFRGEDVELRQISAPSGRRYRHDKLVLWVNGDDTTLRWDDAVILFGCTADASR